MGGREEEKAKEKYLLSTLEYQKREVNLMFILGILSVWKK
jgi:hypothetical protein